MAYSAATRAFKAINSARDDIEKRRKEEGESFTYEPWAVPSEEEQSIRAAQVNQRYADIVQNGPDAAAIAGREAMKNLQAQQKYLQYQREMEEQRNNRLLQNGFTQGDIDASNMYRNASPAQKSALENIYTAQSMIPTGGDRYSGYTSSDYMANQFKKDNSVDDEAYKNLMAGYKAYRAQQALAAQDSYSGVTDEQKKELSRIGETQSTGGILNGITGRTKQSQQEAQSLTDQFKKKYGVDDATYSTWQGMNDQEQAYKEAAGEVSRSGKRTYSQELYYADAMFKVKGKNNSDSLRSDISKYSSMVSEAKMQRSSGLAESASNIQTDFGDQAQKDADSFRESLKKKYALSDNDIDDLVYYGQELDDYSNRQQQKQEAYNNVHQGSTAKNILGGIKNTATALTLNPYAGIGAIGETAKYYGGGYRDKKSPMNVNSVAFGASNATTDYQSATQEALNNKSKVLGTLYGAGMSAIESAETGTLGGAVDGNGLGARVARSALSLAPFGANAYASSISQNVADKDQSQGKAMANALASASVEVATEIASADKFWDIFKNHNATARKRIIDFLVSSGIEGSEEVVGDIADNFIDAALNGKNSEYNQSVRDYMKQGMSREEAKRQATKDTLADTANSFVTGALSGAMGAGIATASGYANDAYNSKTMFDGYTKEDYAQWAEGLDTDPTHYKNASTAQSAEMAKSLAEKMAQEDNATPRQKRELYEYYQDMQNTEMEAAAESEEKENRKDKIEGIKNKVGSFFGRKEATEGQQAAEQTNTTESADTQKTAMVEPQNVPEEHRTQSTDIEPNDAYAKMAAAQNGEELRNAYQEAVHSTNEETRERADSDLQIVSGMLQKRGISAEEIESAKISTEDAYAAGYSGQEISEAVPANVKIAYNDGQKQAIEDRARQTLEARDSVKRTAAKQITDGARTIIEANYKDGMNASAYNDVMSSAINAGRTGMSYENYLKKAGSSVSIVGEDLAKKAYAAGLQVSVNDAVKEFARSMSEKTGVKTFGTGTFTDARSDTSEPFNGSSVMQAVARMTGLNVVLTDQNFREGENGYYKSGNSTIYINSKRAENAASTLFHEVGEFSSVWNQKEYAGVVSDIMKASQNVLGTRTFNNIRQKYVNAYIDEEGKTDADVDKEMANDLIYQFLGNEKGMNKLMDQIDQNHGYKEAKSIKQKLADWVGHMVESIKNFLSDLNPNSYQRKMAEANLQNSEELQDAIVKSIANAEKSYAEAKAQSQQAIESVETDSSRKSKNVDFAGTTISISADGKYGIDEEGRKYPVVDMAGISSSSIKNDEKSVREFVRDKLRELMGKTFTIKSDNTTVKCARDFAEEYVTSRSYSSLNVPTKRVKLNTANNIREIIENAANPRWETNKEKKHNFDAGRGWKYYDTAWLVKRDDNFIPYIGTLCVRMSLDGNNYIYDVIKIKKPPVNGSADVVSSFRRSPMASANNISQNGTDVKPLSADSDTKRMSKQIREVQDVRFSRLVQDSEGRNLSEGQQEFFKDSKLKDEYGRLLVMYHGTPQGGFTVFKPDISYFTANRDYAEEYARASSGNSRVNYTHDPEHKVYEVYLNAKKPFDTRDPKVRKVWEQEFFGKYSRTPLTDRGLLDWTDGYDIWDFIDDNDLDYDAVLLDEGSVPNGNGGTKWRGISYTVRDKNQIKNVDNKTPTDNSDIRRDIGIDDYVTDQELWSDHYDTKKSLIEVLRSGNEILKHSDIDKTAVRRIAREIKEQYHSNIDVNELSENLAKVFQYAQGQDYIDYDDLATVISEVASPVIDGSVTKVGADEFKQFKNALQGATYNLDSKQEAEVVSAFGSWGNFRKAIPGVKFTRDGSGVSLDGVWSTLVQETGYVLDMDTSSNDMPLALVDAYNSMKPEYQNAFGEDATQAAQDVAMEIVARYYQYSAGQEKLKLKAKQKQELLDQARRMAASNAEYRKKIKQEYQKRYEEELSKVRQSGGRSETVSKQVARLRAKNARTVASIREQQKRKDELRMLKTPVKSLMDMLTGPTDKKHVPALVQTPVLQLASVFDFVPQTVRETADGKFSIRILESRDINADGSYSYKWRTIHADSRADAIAQYKKAMDENGLGSAENKSWQESLRAIQDLYQQDEGDDWFERSELKQGLDKELGEKLGEILRKNQGTISIAQLSSDELKTLNAVVRNVLHSINQMNRMYSQPSKQVSDIAHMAMDRTTSGVKGRREHFKPVATLVNTLTLDHASPETYFHGIFGGENTDPVTKTLIGAQNKKVRDIRQASEYMEGVRDKVGVKPQNLESWIKETKNYYGLNLTTTQVMSLYELSKRPDAQQHKIGGFVADESNREKVSGQRLPVQLTDAQIKAITDTLTPQQKQMADAMQYYLAHQCAEQGNETCMQLYGYEKFVDEHYFPMTTDKNTIATRDSNVTQGAINAIKNSGFTKDITPNASNPLVLRDIFAVYSEHVAQMATYHAWAAPIQDLIRFFNYSEKTDVEVDGQTFTGRNSVKDAIDFFYGKSGQEYFVKLLSSINDREKSSFVGGDFYDLMTGHAKTAAVMGNLRVVIQQPTAIFRAGEMISYKYLNEGMAGKYRKEAAELRDRTSDVFWLKNQGNIDGYITQSLVSTITGVKTTREKINDFAGRAASKADEITWGAMYRAVYAEQVDKLGKEKIGTKEFEDAVNERFSEIVLRTQVYDGIITRSQFMRSPDKANRMMSAFMAEPVKTYNIILRDMIDISQATDEQQVKKAVAHLVRITAPVLLITNAVNAVAQSFADALRSAGDPDDEDKDFLRRFMDALGFGNWLDEDASFSDKAWEFLSGNLVDNMDLLSNIPMVAQYWDATKEGVMSVLGESTYSSDSDLSMSGVKNFFKAVKAIVNPSEKMTTYGKVAALTRAFSDLSGYPLYAAQRDVVAIYNTVASQIFKQLPVLQKTTKYTPKKQAKLDVYTAALESGGDYKKAVEDAVAQGNDYKAISKGISDTYKDTYLALKETNPNEAIKMKNRLVTLYVYLSDKAGTNKDKTTSEKTKYYSDNIDKWK